jgi:hypothetical protein
MGMSKIDRSDERWMNTNKQTEQHMRTKTGVLPFPE